METPRYVRRKDNDRSTGVVQADNGDGTLKVRWGIMDGQTYEDDIPEDELETVTHEILSPDEVLKRHAEKAPKHRIEN